MSEQVMAGPQEAAGAKIEELRELFGTKRMVAASDKPNADIMVKGRWAKAINARWAATHDMELVFDGIAEKHLKIKVWDPASMGSNVYEIAHVMDPAHGDMIQDARGALIFNSTQRLKLDVVRAFKAIGFAAVSPRDDHDHSIKPVYLRPLQEGDLLPTTPEEFAKIKLARYVHEVDDPLPHECRACGKMAHGMASFIGHVCYACERAVNEVAGKYDVGHNRFVEKVASGIQNGTHLENDHRTQLTSTEHHLMSLGPEALEDIKIAASNIVSKAMGEAIEAGREHAAAYYQVQVFTGAVLVLTKDPALRDADQQALYEANIKHVMPSGWATERMKAKEAEFRADMENHATALASKFIAKPDARYMGKLVVSRVKRERYMYGYCSACGEFIMCIKREGVLKWCDANGAPHISGGTDRSESWTGRGSGFTHHGLYETFHVDIFPCELSRSLRAKREARAEKRHAKREGVAA